MRRACISDKYGIICLQVGFWGRDNHNPLLERRKNKTCGIKLIHHEKKLASQHLPYHTIPFFLIERMQHAASYAWPCEIVHSNPNFLCLQLYGIEIFSGFLCLEPPDYMFRVSGTLDPEFLDLCLELTNREMWTTQFQSFGFHQPIPLTHLTQTKSPDLSLYLQLLGSSSPLALDTEIQRGSQLNYMILVDVFFSSRT